jgi:hypothetical protein
MTKRDGDLLKRLFIEPDDEEIRRFMALSIEDRLRWLEEAKEFIFSTMPPENKQIWEYLQTIKSE